MTFTEFCVAFIAVNSLLCVYRLGRIHETLRGEDSVRDYPTEKEFEKWRKYDERQNRIANLIESIFSSRRKHSFLVAMFALCGALLVFWVYRTLPKF